MEPDRHLFADPLLFYQTSLNTVADLMHDRFDLVVLGAGPAGCAAAIAARKSGLSVALVDKANFPRDKLCGGLITGRSLKFLSSIFAINPTATIFQASDNVEFLWKNAHLTKIQTPEPLHFAMRQEFDNLLFQKTILEGVTAFENTTVRSFETSTNRVALSDGHVLDYSVLIGADGVNSHLAKHLFGRSFKPRKIGFGLEVESAETDPTKCIQIDFAAVRWGYGWVFPKTNGTTIGVGGLKSENPDLKRALESFSRAGSKLKIKGQFIPFGDFRRAPGHKNILLVGDAAGLVDPITGEGIALALESGALAAQATTRALAARNPNTAYRHYKRTLKETHCNLRLANALRYLIFARPFHVRFRSRLARSNTLQSVFFQLLDGSLNYQTLARMAPRRILRFALRAMLRRT